MWDYFLFHLQNYTILIKQVGYPALFFTHYQKYFKYRNTENKLDTIQQAGEGY